MDKPPQIGRPIDDAGPMVICQIEGGEKQRESQVVANKVLKLYSSIAARA